MENNIGDIIKFGGYEWIILDKEADKVLVLAKEAIAKMPFDENNSNNFSNSTLCKFLNGDFIKRLKAGGADVSAIIPTTIDLTSSDGLKDYDETTQKVFLLTCDVYRKYRSIIPSLDDWWWLATAHSTESNGYSNITQFVIWDGSLQYCSARSSNLDVRPACYLKSSILESCSSSLAEFTTEELLQELIRRNDGEN